MRFAPDGQFSWWSLLFYLVLFFSERPAEEILFRGYAFQLLIQEAGPVGHCAAGGCPVRICPCGEPERDYAWDGEHSIVGDIFGLCVSAQPGSVAAHRTSLWMEFCSSAVRGQPERAYNRGDEVQLPMGPRSGVEWRKLWPGRRAFLPRSLSFILILCLHRVPVVPQRAHIAVCSTIWNSRSAGCGLLFSGARSIVASRQAQFRRTGGDHAGLDGGISPRAK